MARRPQLYEIRIDYADDPESNYHHVGYLRDVRRALPSPFTALYRSGRMAPDSLDVVCELTRYRVRKES